MRNGILIFGTMIGLMISSCGSETTDKEKSKDSEEKKTEEPKEQPKTELETGCDCMELMVEELRLLKDLSDYPALSERLQKEYPECDRLMDEMMTQYNGPTEAIKDCPAILELQEFMKKNMPQSEEAPAEEPAEE